METVAVVIIIILLIVLAVKRIRKNKGSPCRNCPMSSSCNKISCSEKGEKNE